MTNDKFVHVQYMYNTCTRDFQWFFSIDMQNNILTNVNDISFNIVFLWLDIFDLPPRQCIYTLAVEGWTALPAELFYNQR